MPGQAASLSLTLTLLVARWVSVSRCGITEAPGCDNGKLSLDRDLPAAPCHWDCPLSPWPEMTRGRPARDTVYIPELATQMCMNQAILYNHTIPNSGAHRPVRAESGEYVYCPPQRWLNNLHHGAAVLLFHPCAPLHQRRLLALLARSCLSDYVITPHPHLSQQRPIALVSWGRTLELSTVASLDVCHWLETTTSSRNESSGGNNMRTYDLLLIRSAKMQHSTLTKVAVRQCCEQTISPLLNEAVQAELESSRGKESSGGKGRRIRAAMGDTREDVKDEKQTDATSTISASETGDKQNDATTQGPPEDSPSGNTTLSDPLGRTNVLSLNPTLELNVSRITGDLQPDLMTTLTETRTDDETANPSAHTEVVPDAAQPEVPDLSSTVEVKDTAEERRKDLKESDGGSTADAKKKGNDVVDVRERELEHKQTQSASLPHQKSANNNNFVSNSQSDSQAAVDQDCDGCKPGERCDCPKTSEADGKAGVMGLPKTPRSDEAVWAAAALGFLLVLLTLSVLHTRLYRHWRTAPSMYWHDPRQDYDSVADVIRRRLRIANQRRKRGRRKECVLLPSSSSSDELA